ncbi:sll0787 family AIR synthase-like protein [Pacificibacter marinus]|nr:sll0787 family AIR synthase-like protein [Pacificibacter marinus]
MRGQTALMLEEMAGRLRAHPSIRSKLGIASATRGLGLTALSYGRPGDDAAALPCSGGYDLLAGEGFIPAFIKDDPWFAGWCAVMVNLSDIAAMGGRSTAVIDQIWAPSAKDAAPLLQGMRDASAAYGVPLVGGHTNLSAQTLGLAASVFGKAQRLITSFDATPGDLLIAAIDHRGNYRNFDNFCAAIDTPAERLRGDLMLLPALAEEALVCAGKDISQGGIIGTALMLAECSNVGININLSEINPPDEIEAERWLRSFPSFGFLLSVAPENAQTVCTRFAARGIDARAVGCITEGSVVTLGNGDERAVFWDYAQTPYLDLGANHA